MANIKSTVRWTMGSGDFLKGRYSRNHEWSFDGGATMTASASPAIVPPPNSDPAAVDPEEALLAAISSCHMLSFLYAAMKKGFQVSSYEDHATATMAKNASGTMWVDAAVLNPRIEWAGKTPSSDELNEMHHTAHEHCFIANSVKTAITIAQPAATPSVV